MNLLSRVIFAAAACALALGGGQVQAQTPPTYVSPSGTNLPAAVVSIFGLDSVTGLKCLIGTSSTCLVPTTPASGGGVAASVNVSQIGGATVTAGPTQVADINLPQTLGTDGGAYPSQWLGMGCGRNAAASISTGLGNLVTCDAKGKLEIAIGIDGSSTFLTALNGHANDNVSGSTALATGVYAACNDTTVATVTEDNFTTARLDCGSHVLLTRPFETRANSWNYATSSGITNTTTAVTVKTAAGSGLRNCITGIDISADPLGTATVLAIRDGAGGTVIWAHKIGTAGLPAFSKNFASPVCSSTNSLLEIVTLTASTTGAVLVQLQGYAQ